ncbi:hypothetical protein ACFX1R_009516 [Malus domestica]
MARLNLHFPPPIPFRFPRLTDYKSLKKNVGGASADAATSSAIESSRRVASFALWVLPMASFAYYLTGLHLVTTTDGGAAVTEEKRDCYGWLEEIEMPENAEMDMIEYLGPQVSETSS